MKKIVTILLFLICVLSSCVETKYVVAYDDCYVTTAEYSQPVVVSPAPVYIFSPNLFNPYTYVYTPYVGVTFNLFGGWSWYNPYYYHYYVPYRNPYWYYGYYDHHHFHPYPPHNPHPLWMNNGPHNNHAWHNPTHGNPTFGHRSNIGPSVGNNSPTNRPNVTTSRPVTQTRPVTTTTVKPTPTTQHYSRTVTNSRVNNTVKQPITTSRPVSKPRQRPVTQPTRPYNNSYKPNAQPYKPSQTTQSRTNYSRVPSSSSTRVTHSQTQRSSAPSRPVRR